MMRWWTGLWLAAMLVNAGCGPKQPLPGGPAFVFPDSLPRHVGVVTFLGEQTVNDTVTDAFAIGLARMHFYPVHRFLIEAEDNDQVRLVAGSDAPTRAMWYESLIDSAARLPDAYPGMEGMFVGSFAGVAVALDEAQEQIMPTGVLNIQLIGLSPRRVVWETTVYDRKVFFAAMNLKASAVYMVQQALRELKNAYRLPGDIESLP
jgi:hypothetical protein